MAMSARTAAAAAFALALCTAASAAPHPTAARVAADGPSACRRTLVVVAHPDDDLLFVNPDVMTAIAGNCFVSTVYLTAGDGDEEVPQEAKNYVLNRENGVRKAYAEMAGVPDHWTADTVRADGRGIRSFRLADGVRGKDVRLTFLGLYDGKPKGGEPQSLLRLFKADRKAITPVQGGMSYTEEQLVSVLADLIRQARADTVLTLDPDVASFATGTDGHVDHSDHAITARYAREAAYRTGTHPYYYRGYTVAPLSRNLTPAETLWKERITRWYLATSQCPREHVCAPAKDAKAALGRTFRSWVERRYQRTHRDPRPGEILAELGRTTRRSGDTAEQCLTTPARSWNREPVRLHACDGSTGQKWNTAADHTVRPRLNPKYCLTAADTSARLSPCRPSDTNQSWRALPWSAPHWKRTAWRLSGAKNSCLYQNDRHLPRWNSDTDQSPRLELVNCTGPPLPGLYWRSSPPPPG
ncbi:lipoprotein [Streptomyces roseochromogenus]|nr:lipoprotein [Streptomyces roseochromogenus]